MAAAHSTRPLAGHPHHTNTCADEAVAAVQRALDLLGRASSDWRNGGQSAEGALHWPVSVNLARRALREALEVLEPRQWSPERPDLDDDACAGIAWFNALSPAERRHWLEVANSALPADAWACYKADISALA